MKQVLKSIRKQTGEYDALVLPRGRISIGNPFWNKIRLHLDFQELGISYGTSKGSPHSGLLLRYIPDGHDGRYGMQAEEVLIRSPHLNLVGFDEKRDDSQKQNSLSLLFSLFPTVGVGINPNLDFQHTGDTPDLEDKCAEDDSTPIKEDPYSYKLPTGTAYSIKK